MQKALDLQSFGLAIRYRADLTTIQSRKSRPLLVCAVLTDSTQSSWSQVCLAFSKLSRHKLTIRHTLGSAMSNYLDTYLKTGGKGKAPDTARAIDNINTCLDPTRADSFPVLPSDAGFNASANIPYTAFPTNTAQFQENVHMDFGSTTSSTFASFSAQGQSGQTQAFGQGTIDMSTYLTQMNMNGSNENNSTSAQGFGGFDYDYGKQGMGGEAYISPESYNSNSYASSSRNHSGSSKTTPESATLVDPTFNSYPNSSSGANSVSKGTGTSTGILPAGMGDFIQVGGEGRFAQLSEYFDGSRN
jgi:hypothetical protein